MNAPHVPGNTTTSVSMSLNRSLSPALIAGYQVRLSDKQLLQARLHEFYALNVAGLT